MPMPYNTLHAEKAQALSYSNMQSRDTDNNVATSNKNYAGQDIKSLEPKKKHKKHNGLYRFFKNFNDIDTTYIEPNHFNYTAMVQETNLMNFYTLQGKNESGKKQEISFKTEPRFKMGPYIGWHWLFLGYNFDIGRRNTSNKTTQYNISLYSSTIGIDYIYSRNKGDYTISETKGFGKGNNIKDVHFEGLNTYINSVNIYYIFNHKHFSYPAAFSQSTQQKKSCGSVVLGIVYAHQKLDFDYTKLPANLLKDSAGNDIIFDELKFDKVNFYDYSISCGYAYNWVFARNFLFAASLSPAIGYKFSKGQSIDHKQLFSSHNINIDAIGRFGIVWNNSRFFGGASALIHAYSYRKSHFRLQNAIAIANIYFGVNFLAKGKYRRARKNNR